MAGLTSTADVAPYGLDREVRRSTTIPSIGSTATSDGNSVDLAAFRRPLAGARRALATRGLYADGAAHSHLRFRGCQRSQRRGARRRRVSRIAARAT